MLWPNRFSFFTSMCSVEFQKRNVSFPFSPFGLQRPSKCKKGNDNYTFVTTYYSNFGELIALMCPNQHRPPPPAPLLIHKCNENVPLYLAIVSFEEILGCFHAYQSFHSFCVWYFLSFDRFSSFRSSVYNLLSHKTCTWRENLISFYLQVQWWIFPSTKNVTNNIWSVGSLTWCQPVSSIVSV